MGKGMKQRLTTVFFALLVVTSFCMGHSTVKVQEHFWQEQVILWVATVIATGMWYNEFTITFRTHRMIERRLLSYVFIPTVHRKFLCIFNIFKRMDI